MPEMIFDLLILFILVAFSGFFSAVEIALFSLTPAKVRYLVEKKISGADLVQKMKNRPQELLITILIGNNVANILAASFATSVAIQLFGSAGVGIATGVMTFFILVFGEIAPKSFASSNSQRVALLSIRPLYFLYLVLFPLVYVFTFLTRLFAHRRISSKKISEEEIMAATSLGLETGVVEKDEKEMIEKVFQLNDIVVSDVMMTWGNVFAMDAGMSVVPALSEFREHEFSRTPVYEGDEKNIIGVVHVKDVIEALYEQKDVKLRDIMFEPMFCSPDERLDHLLQRFRKNSQHLAIVKNYHGQVVGVIALEDVLEQLVGEIEDESDE